jgi:nitrogen fixation protein FixH
VVVVELARLLENEEILMTISLRQRVGDVYVVAKAREDGTWNVEVLAEFGHETKAEEREEALRVVMKELSSLRGHIWNVLGSK